jgi:hypothetical protein
MWSDDKVVIDGERILIDGKEHATRQKQILRKITLPKSLEVKCNHLIREARLLRERKVRSTGESA